MPHVATWALTFISATEAICYQAHARATDPVAGATDPVAGELVEPVDVAALSPAVHVVDAVLAGAARVDQLRVPHLAARLVQECQQNKKKLQKNCVSK